MDTSELLGSPAAVLPRDRDDQDFERYMASVFDEYLRGVSSLDSSRRLDVQILAARDDIERLNDLILKALGEYLAGSPAAAYGHLVAAVEFVYLRLSSLQSIPVDPDSVGPLYRLARTDDALPGKERLFHTPFGLRHKVGQHRYGIPGFPCLYLGGSLELCASECRVSGEDLPKAAVAAFAFRRAARFLDFGYRPSVMAHYARAATLGNNPGLDKLVVSYAVCWPLLAACSIKRMHDGEPFAHEYIIPQMVLQWVMSKEECDGVRFFSTRFESAESPIKKVVNYVFPATHDIDLGHSFSRRLRDLFEFTDPVLWGTRPPENVEAALVQMTKSSL
ncbi:hypothetical protein ACFQX9_22705 [Bradyrhizobium sp. GCM10028915]|uniref:hypothetical protein n=1 Tax=Bradyrhizobium sp. GCM10028915 TaxID=3273385 RepID=UPI00361F6D41